MIRNSIWYAISRSHILTLRIARGMLSISSGYPFHIKKQISHREDLCGSVPRRQGRTLVAYNGVWMVANIFTQQDSKPYFELWLNLTCFPNKMLRRPYISGLAKCAWWPTSSHNRILNFILNCGSPNNVTWLQMIVLGERQYTFNKPKSKLVTVRLVYGYNFAPGKNS